MSSSLVRKSLELLEAEWTNSKETEVSRKSSTDKRKKPAFKSKEKLKRREKIVSGEISQAAQLIERARKTVSVNKDNTEQNLRSLSLLTSANTASSTNAIKILERCVRRKDPIDAAAPIEDSSVFTEEDFKKFEEEYFVS